MDRLEMTGRKDTPTPSQGWPRGWGLGLLPEGWEDHRPWALAF